MKVDEMGRHVVRMGKGKGKGKVFPVL